MRSGALRQIKVAQVDLQHGIVRPAQSSSKKRIGKGLPIYGELRGRLEMALTEIKTSYPDCVWLFHKQGQRIGYFRRSWVSATRRAGVPGLLFHDLRRTAVVNMDRAGLSREVIMSITGHQTDSMFRRYRIVHEQDLQDARWRMERHREGTVQGTVREVSGDEGPVNTRKTLN
jgi:integrase